MAMLNNQRANALNVLNLPSVIECYRVFMTWSLLLAMKEHGGGLTATFNRRVLRHISPKLCFSDSHLHLGYLSLTFPAVVLHLSREISEVLPV